MNFIHGLFTMYLVEKNEKKILAKISELRKKFPYLVFADAEENFPNFTKPLKEATGYLVLIVNHFTKTILLSTMPETKTV